MTSPSKIGGGVGLILIGLFLINISPNKIVGAVLGIISIAFGIGLMASK